MTGTYNPSMPMFWGLRGVSNWVKCTMHFFYNYPELPSNDRKQLATWCFASRFWVLFKPGTPSMRPETFATGIRGTHRGTCTPYKALMPLHPVVLSGSCGLD